jgi:hypothetical protein
VTTASRSCSIALGTSPFFFWSKMYRPGPGLGCSSKSGSSVEGNVIAIFFHSSSSSTCSVVLEGGEGDLHGGAWIAAMDVFFSCLESLDTYWKAFFKGGSIVGWGRSAMPSMLSSSSSSLLLSTRWLAAHGAVEPVPLASSSIQACSLLPAVFHHRLALPYTRS